ncbi:hypothetical protein FSP39_021703 [Pinctada imbricata]|uniref:Major facilitator superfamily (MFS) profile domain-containing protein n=1 Tax=Pinctada imbricata TaxID=66713 RepID=A0AA88Y538_PINIB|nr:hypothetical protein FSP39_021703 [Pinctada imbricata]
MDYETILQQIGDFGTYQKRLLLVVFFPVLFNSFSTPISNFLVGDHKHRCKIPDVPNDTFAIQDSNHSLLVNSSIPILDDGNYDPCHIIVNGSKTTCEAWVFDNSVFTSTINSQFNLVCEKKLSNSHAIATYFFGQVTAPLLVIPLADVIGRRLVACITLTVVFIVNIAMPFSNSVYVFAVLRYFDGFFGASLYNTAFVIGIELVGASKRVIAGTVILLVFCAGEFVLAVLAYFIRDWRWLQLTVAVPMIIPLIYWWPRVLPESVRWLMARGRMEEATVILRRAAKTNKRPLAENVRLKYKEEKTSNIQILKELFSSRKLLFYWAITSANWFVVAFIYYGIKTNIGALGGNLYVSFTLVTTAETLGYIPLFAMDVIGHKRLHMVSMGATCAACIASIFPILFAGNSLQWLTVMFALLGKLFVSTAFGMIFVYTGEIFPTVVRSFTLGSCGVFARIGSLCSPYLYHMAEGKMRKALPLILYGVIITVVTLLTILLPETKRKKLPDHVKESESEFTNGCKIPSYPNDTYAIQDPSHAALVNSTIPLTEDGTYDQCHVMVNGSKITCDDWVFDYSVFTNTINSQFKLVCERKLANPHAIVTYFIGQMTSPFLMIPLADIIGRRLVACISLTLIFVVNIAMPFSNSVYMFAVMRYFDGFFGTALYTTAFVIGIELLGASKRLIAGTVILLVFCAGEFILVFLAYFIRDWRWLQLAVAIPMLVPIVYWWPKILPESVRWLISRGRMDEALVILRQAAQVNKTNLPSDLKITYNDKETSSFQILKHLFSSRKLLLYWAIAALNWFVVAFIYYGIKTNIGKLGGDLYVSFTLIVIAETLGYSLLFFMDLIGHKRLHMVAMGTTCVVCVASIFPILFGGEDLQWMTVAFALLGKMSVSTAFGMVYVYTGEIFPTVVRSFAIGSCAVFARIGSLSAPYLYYMTEGIMNRALPLILYGVIISLVTLLTLILPETKGKKLPDHVKESENSDGVLDSESNCNELNELCPESNRLAK